MKPLKNYNNWQSSNMIKKEIWHLHTPGKCPWKNHPLINKIWRGHKHLTKDIIRVHAKFITNQKIWALDENKNIVLGDDSPNDVEIVAVFE